MPNPASLRTFLCAGTLCVAACTSGEPSPTPAVSLAASELPSPAGPNSGEPFLAADAQGRLHMTWLERATDSTWALRYASYADGRWTAPATIASRADFFVNWADFPSVVPTSGGRLVTHWLQRSGGGKYAYDVRIAQSSDSGRTWTPSRILHGDGLAAEHGFVALWPSDGDRVGAAWLDGRGTVNVPDSLRAMRVVATSIAADGSTTPEEAIDMRSCDCCQVTSAMTSRGPIVAYRDRTPDEIRDIVVSRRLEGGWTPPATVHDDRWQIAACPVNGPALAARGDTVVIAWFTGAQDTARVHAAWSFDAGAQWTPPVRIDGGDPAGRVDVELLPDARAAVSWLERTDSTGAEVRVRRLATDGSAAAPVTIARSKGARASGFPRMARRASALVFAWTQPGDTARVHISELPLEKLP